MEDKIVRAISGDGMVQAAAIYSRNQTERARRHWAARWQPRP